MVLHAILMDYIQVSVHEIVNDPPENVEQEEYLTNLILKTSRLSYTVCNEFIGWEFIRESTNAQEFLKILSDDLEKLLIESFNQAALFKADPYSERLRFLIKASKSIVFSFDTTSQDGI